MSSQIRSFIYHNLRFLRPLFNLRHFFYAWWGSVRYRKPSNELFVIGITGTSGKSSTIDFMRQIFEAAGYTVGSLSTVDFYVAGERTMNDQKMTMLGRTAIQRYLRRMVQKKCDIAIVEVTSEGRVQHRHRFINYDIMALTNFYPEHIESHGSLAAYRQAKRDIFRYASTRKKKRRLQHSLIKKTDAEKIAVINADTNLTNDFGSGFDQVVSFGREKGELRVSNIEMNAAGLSFTMFGEQLTAGVFGTYNATNILCAAAVAVSAGVERQQVLRAVTALKPVAGRIEFIQEAEEHGFKVIVDYAFEPVAIKELYRVVDLLQPKRIIHVFGSTGGGRDVERRFSVGAFVGAHADICIITDEDPYDDDPMEIIHDVASAVIKAGKEKDKNCFLILERAKALQKAVDVAETGDIILATGKGSEQAMVVKGSLIPWDDRAALRSAIEKKKTA